MKAALGLIPSLVLVKSQNTFLGWYGCLQCSSADGLLYHESQSLSNNKVCDYHIHSGSLVQGVCCDNVASDYSGEVSKSCKSTSDGGISHNFCALGSITELGPIWYSHCSDIAKYAEAGLERTVCESLKAISSPQTYES